MTVSHCPVCGCMELRCDEVLHFGRMLLIECPRCLHRSTERVSGVPPMVVRAEPIAEGVAA